MSKIKSQKSKLFLIILIALFVLYFIYKNVTSSVFLKKKDRINVVFYSQNSAYFSLGFVDINYLLVIPADTDMLVPGGYGYYRLGALGKLVSLEQRPELFKKTFSAATSSLVDLYFYPADTEIYYGQSSIPKFPTMADIFLNKSSGNIVDRLFIWAYFLNKNINQFKIVTKLPISSVGPRAVFDRGEFFKNYQGFFYNKTYRNLKENVQILYTKSYKTASLLSNIIDGEGIRVVDLSQKDNISGKCLLIQNKDKAISATTEDLHNFFSCAIQKGQTDVSDIILILGNLEKEWAVE